MIRILNICYRKALGIHVNMQSWRPIFHRVYQQASCNVFVIWYSGARGFWELYPKWNWRHHEAIIVIMILSSNNIICYDEYYVTGWNHHCQHDPEGALCAHPEAPLWPSRPPGHPLYRHLRGGADHHSSTPAGSQQAHAGMWRYLRPPPPQEK